MLQISHKKWLLVSLLSLPLSVFAEEKGTKHFDDDTSALEIKNLCAKKIKARCLDAERIIANAICAKKLSVSEDFVALNARINSECVNNLTAQNMCVTGTLQANSLQICEKYRAFLTFNSAYTYTLGTDVPWDVIVDDPNNNVSFVPATHYTAPVSGYYVLSTHLDLRNFIPTNPTQILGSPVAELQTHVNGIAVSEVYSPFLTFFNSQKALLSTIVRLNAGDTVTTRLQVIVVDPTLGQISVPGTIVIDAVGGEQNSYWSIHILSENCTPISCQNTPCDVKPLDCDACHTQCCPSVGSR